MMKVEVIIPEEYLGDIMGDITCTSWSCRRYGSSW